MLLGPVLGRELVIAPRRPRIYIVRSAYVAALLMLVFTVRWVVWGMQELRDLGDLARLGAVLFQLLATLQLAMAVFASAGLAATAVAHEKDRRTFELLLLTWLTNFELVVGKLAASLLYVMVMLAAAAPLFMFLPLLGGVSFYQIGLAYAITVTTALLCGTIGSTVALWREKTFQALAATALALVIWLAGGELIGLGLFGSQPLGMSADMLAAVVSPRWAMLLAVQPYQLAQQDTLLPLGPLGMYLAAAVAATVVLNAIAVLRVRKWNPGQESTAVPSHTAVGRGAEQPASATVAPQTVGQEAVASQTLASQAVAPRTLAAEIPTPATEVAASAEPAPTSRPAEAPGGSTRHVWDNPVLWREMCTWAYGRRMLLIRLAYLLLFALAVGAVHWMAVDPYSPLPSGPVASLVGLLLISLVLVNVQAVTSLTSERDAAALDLLLVTDLTPKEIIFGKLGGVFYNTKEMIVLPMLLCVYLAAVGRLGGQSQWENLVYLLTTLAVLYVFVAVLGIHAGMIYSNTHTAIGVSLGTLFLLFLGVAVCMWILVVFRGAFQVQLWPFAALFLGGGVGLYLALGARNPSAAIGVAAFVCPFATFYAITSYLLGATLGVCLVTVGVYGFATAAMLVPAIYEFDVATGRTTVEEA